MSFLALICKEEGGEEGGGEGGVRSMCSGARRRRIFRKSNEIIIINMLTKSRK